MFSRAELAEVLDRPRMSELCIQETWYENCGGAKKRESLERMEHRQAGRKHKIEGK
jgi:hypothetical protein